MVKQKLDQKNNCGLWKIINVCISILKMFMRVIIFLIALFICQLQAQNFVNGDFETNSAHGDQINLTHAALNAMLPGVKSFGSYGDVDIITSNTYGQSGAQNKNWYIALTGGKTDIVSLELTVALQRGKKYSISYYDRKTDGYQATPLQMGLSDKDNEFGTIIYTGTENPEHNKWKKREFTFIAPINGKYITVQMPQGALGDWVNIDNFSFTDNNNKDMEVPCPTSITINSSTLQIKKGASVTLTANGSAEIYWSNNQNIETKVGNMVTFFPNQNTIYTVSGKQQGCSDITNTVVVNVIEAIVKVKPDSMDVIKTDSLPVVKRHFVKFTKNRLNGRKYQVLQTLDVENESINIQVYDKNRVDGDIVSIYLNGELLIENLQVTKEKKEIKLQLQSGSNILVMYAINLGRIPPNTAAIAVGNKGNKYKISTLVSDFKKSGALELIYNPDGLSLK